MKTFLGAMSCAFSVLLVAGCAAPLNRATEVALNKPVGIDVASVVRDAASRSSCPKPRCPSTLNKSEVRADSGAVVDRSAVLPQAAASSRSSSRVIPDNVGTLEYNQEIV